MFVLVESGGLVVMFDGVGEEPGGDPCVVQGKVEAHPGGGGEHVRRVPGRASPASPVPVGDGCGHLEGADLHDLDRQGGDPGGGAEQGCAPLVAGVVDALAALRVPGDAADPAVGGIGEDEDATTGGGILDPVHHERRGADVLAQGCVEQDADPVAEVPRCAATWQQSPSSTYRPCQADAATSLVRGLGGTVMVRTAGGRRARASKL